MTGTCEWQYQSLRRVASRGSACMDFACTEKSNRLSRVLVRQMDTTTYSLLPNHYTSVNGSRLAGPHIFSIPSSQYTVVGCLERPVVCPSICLGKNTSPVDDFVLSSVTDRCFCGDFLRTPSICSRQQMQCKVTLTSDVFRQKLGCLV